MGIKETLLTVADELASTFADLDEAQLQDLEARIKVANRIFVAGAGRSLMMVRALAMRLMHLGLASHVVGETVTPAIAPGDLLIIASGSGSTGTLTVIAERCKALGADLALITTRPDSPIGQLADAVVEVHAVSTKVEGYASTSAQLGCSTFEQSALLIGDALVADLARGIPMADNNECLMRRHANLE